MAVMFDQPQDTPRVAAPAADATVGGEVNRLILDFIADLR